MRFNNRVFAELPEMAVAEIRQNCISRKQVKYVSYGIVRNINCKVDDKRQQRDYENKQDFITRACFSFASAICGGLFSLSAARFSALKRGR